MDDRLLHFLREPVMMVAAAADRGGAPALARVMGARPAAEDGDLLELFLSRRQWPEVLEALHPGDWFAFTLCRPSTYETYQVKGSVASVEPADEDGLASARAYMEAVTAHLTTLGVQPGQIAPWLCAEDLHAVRLRPARLFDQTPGPAAGRAL